MLGLKKYRKRFNRRLRMRRTIFLREVGKILRATRIEKCLPISVLADITDLEPKKISHIECGHLDYLSLHDAHILCAALDIDIDWLVYRAMPPKRQFRETYGKDRKPKPPKPPKPISDRRTYEVDTRRAFDGNKKARVPMWRERDHIVPPEPKPGSMPFGWRNRLEKIQSRSKRSRKESNEKQSDAGQITKPAS